MSELILTEEEKATETFLEWDDAALGKAVKRLALVIKDVYGEDAMTTAGAAALLVAQGVEVNDEHFVINLYDTFIDGKELGDWVISFKKKATWKDAFYKSSKETKSKEKKSVFDKPFDERCKSNPQGVIADLLDQGKRQAKIINDQNKTIKTLEKSVADLEKQLSKVKKDEKD